MLHKNITRLVRLSRRIRDAQTHRVTLWPLLTATDPAGAVRPYRSQRAEVALRGDARPAVPLAIGVRVRCPVVPPHSARIRALCGVASADPDIRIRVTLSYGSARSSGTLTARDGWVPLALRVPGSPRHQAGSVELAVERIAGEGEAVAYLAEPAMMWRKSLRGMLSGVCRALATRNGPAARKWISQTASVDPVSDYRAWRASRTHRHSDASGAIDEIARFAVRPSFAVLLWGDRDPDRLRRTLASLSAQVYPHWDLASVDTGASSGDGFNVLAEKTAADFVIRLACGDELAPDALFAVARFVNDHPDTAVVYSDEDFDTPDGAVPIFKPGWSPEYLTAKMYIGRGLWIRRVALLGMGGYRGEAGSDALDYDVVLRALARGIEAGHVPQVLLHHSHENRLDAARCAAAERRVLERYCAETGQPAAVEPGLTADSWYVRRRRRTMPRVSIVIPTDGRSARDRGEPLVVRCIRSVILRTPDVPIEVIVAHNGCLPPGVDTALGGTPHQIVEYASHGAFNFSRKLNYVVNYASHEFVLLMNDDIEALEEGWLEAMLEYAQLTSVGAVGAKLYYPDGRLQHVGVALGVCGIAAHLLHQQSEDRASAQPDLAFVPRNCSAVTGACLLTRRSIYRELGGFDERLHVDFNDVDFCLRLRRAGFRIVFTPYARLLHHESATFGSRVQHPRDIAMMREIWGDALSSDPYYNPNLSRDSPDCRISTVTPAQMYG